MTIPTWLPVALLVLQLVLVAATVRHLRSARRWMKQVARVTALAEATSFAAIECAEHAVACTECLSADTLCPVGKVLAAEVGSLAQAVRVEVAK